MKAVFISDAHLKNPSDENYKILLSFLDNLTDADILIILGDLFDFWNGHNKIAHKHHKLVLDRLLKIKNLGTKIIYLEGNHDFFLGRFFTETLGADVFSNEAELMLDGKKIFMAHGDMINTRDYGYRMIRWFLRSWFMKLIFTALPSSVVWRAANSMSKGSRTYLAKDFEYEKIFTDYARDKWSNYDAVIIGHCHNPRLLKEVINGREKFYLNPGDWLTHFTYIVYENGSFRMEDFLKNWH